MDKYYVIPFIKKCLLIQEKIASQFHWLKERIDEANGNIHPVLVPMLSSYHASLIQVCSDAIERSEELVKDWLANFMFKDLPNKKKEELSEKIAKAFADYSKHKAHGKPIMIDEAIKLGLVIEDIRENSQLLSAVRSYYARLEYFLSNTEFYKIYESENNSFGSKVPLVFIDPKTGMPISPPTKTQPTKKQPKKKPRTRRKT